MVAGLLLAIATPALGHSLSVAHLDISAQGDDGDLRLELDLSLRDLALSLPLDANADEQVTWGELQAMQQPLQALAVAGLEVSTAGGPCRLTATGLATRRYEDGTYAALQLHASCPPGQAWQLRYDLLFDQDPQHRAVITVREGNATSTTIASADQRIVTRPQRSGSTFPVFLREGVHHILVGYDHLAFLLLLLLPAVLVREQGRWRPVAHGRSCLGRVLAIVTAFTLAHSFSLSAAALDWVTPPTRWVEMAIAGSVVLAALNNIWPVAVKRAWLAAFGFGLVHGFGFAGALGELGLPRGAEVLALLGFNLGVEAGQLAVVALVLPVLWLVHRRSWYAALVLPAVSLAIAAAGTYWLVQRAGS